MPVSQRLNNKNNQQQANLCKHATKDDKEKKRLNNNRTKEILKHINCKKKERMKNKENSH